MKKYTKQIAVLASLALFAPWVNAQTVNPIFEDMTVEGDATVNGSLFVAPAADPDPDLLSLDGTGATSGTLELDNSGPNPTVTRIDFEGTATGDVTTSTVTGGANDSVIINNDGITLNTVTTATDTTTLDRFVESVTTFVDGTTSTEFTAYATAGGADGDRLVTVTGESKDEALQGLNDQLTGFTAASAEISEARVNDLAPTTTGGNLQIGGNANVDGVLSVAGDADPDGDPSTEDGYDGVDNVAQAIGTNATDIAQNTNAITTLNGNAEVEGSVDNKVAALANGAVTENTNAITTLNGDAEVDGSVDNKVAALANGAVTENTNAITTLNGNAEVDGSVDNKLSELVSELGLTNPDHDVEPLKETEVGIAGVAYTDIETGETRIGQNSLVTAENNGVQELWAEDGNGEAIDILIGNGSNLGVDGNINVAGDVFVGGRTQGLQSQVDRNRSDIDRNARGIAMVAALQHTTVLPDMTHALDLSAAHFEGETGMALNYARRINDNVQINFGAASTSDFDESVIKAGVGFQW